MALALPQPWYMTSRPLLVRELMIFATVGS